MPLGRGELAPWSQGPVRWIAVPVYAMTSPHDDTGQPRTQRSSSAESLPKPPRRRNTGRALALLMTLGCCVGTLPASADVYVHVDPDGTRHFTNVPSGGRSWKLLYREEAQGKPGAKRQRATRGRTDSARYRRYDAFLREAAGLYQLPEALLRAVVRVESDFRPEAVSPDGARGLMQLMPATGRSMGVRDPFDPRQNILGGSRFLRVLANRFDGNIELTLAGYNAGEGAVRKYGNKIPPYPETQRYVRRVLAHYNRYLRGLADS